MRLLAKQCGCCVLFLSLGVCDGLGSPVRVDGEMRRKLFVSCEHGTLGGLLLGVRTLQPMLLRWLIFPD